MHRSTKRFPPFISEELRKREEMEREVLKSKLERALRPSFVDGTDHSAISLFPPLSSPHSSSRSPLSSPFQSAMVQENGKAPQFSHSQREMMSSKNPLFLHGLGGPPAAYSRSGTTTFSPPAARDFQNPIMASLDKTLEELRSTAQTNWQNASSRQIRMTQMNDEDELKADELRRSERRDAIRVVAQGEHLKAMTQDSKEIRQKMVDEHRMDSAHIDQMTSFLLSLQKEVEETEGSIFYAVRKKNDQLHKAYLQRALEVEKKGCFASGARLQRGNGSGSSQQSRDLRQYSTSSNSSVGQDSRNAAHPSRKSGLNNALFYHPPQNEGELLRMLSSEMGIDNYDNGADALSALPMIEGETDESETHLQVTKPPTSSLEEEEEKEDTRKISRRKRKEKRKKEKNARREAMQKHQPVREKKDDEEDTEKIREEKKRLRKKDSRTSSSSHRSSPDLKHQLSVMEHVLRKIAHREKKAMQATKEEEKKLKNVSSTPIERSAKKHHHHRHHRSSSSTKAGDEEERKETTSSSEKNATNAIRKFYSRLNPSSTPLSSDSHAERDASFSSSSSSQATALPDTSSAPSSSSFIPPSSRPPPLHAVSTRPPSPVSTPSSSILSTSPLTPLPVLQNHTQHSENLKNPVEGTPTISDLPSFPTPPTPTTSSFPWVSIDTHATPTPPTWEDLNSSSTSIPSILLPSSQRFFREKTDNEQT